MATKDWRLARSELDSMESKIKRLVKKEIKRVSKIPQDNILWHYTSAMNAREIIEKSELWSSDVGALNDASEVKFGIDQLRKIIDTKLDELDTDAEEDEILLSMRRGLPESIDEILDLDYYIASLSVARDDLSQWRAYGGGTGGVALGFSINEKMTSDPQFPSSILYEERDIERVISSLFNEILAEYRVWATANREFFGVLESTSARLAVRRRMRKNVELMIPIFARMKDRVFSGEMEYRIGFRLKDVSVNSIRIANRISHLSSHVSIPISIGKRDDKLLNLTHILVGPAQYQKRTERALSLFMSQKYSDVSHTIEIESSTIPYR